MRQSKVFSYLGLAMRGRNLVSGEFQTDEAIKKGTACIVIVASDASGNTKKHFNDKCTFYDIPIYEYGTKEELGRAIGRDLRSSIGVCDTGLADAIIKQIETEQII